jgi:hypothetical protein
MIRILLKEGSGIKPEAVHSGHPAPPERVLTGPAHTA